MQQRYIRSLSDRRLAEIGNKAAKLRFLQDKGFRVPVTYICTWDAYERYLQDDVSLIDDLRLELANTITPDQRYAIRSSASLEDGPGSSFAGQFKTVLNAQGIDDVLSAVGSIWATTRTPSVQAYVTKRSLDPQELLMAVLIQEMVTPEVSGVAFSKNPMTGTDEVVVEAVQGGGEALVQEGVTPQRWVNKWGTWTLEPDTSPIELDLIAQVVAQTKKIAQTYGGPVDLEWIYDGQAIHWVQLRDITSVNVDLYCNRISREVFPGLIKPLIWSINVPLVNGAWVRLFTELIGPNDIDPNSLAKMFYYQAYFNMGTIGRIFEMMGLPRKSLELLMGLEVGGPDKPSFKPTPKTFRLLPRMLGTTIGKLRFARKIEAFLPAIKAQYRTFEIERIGDMNARELLQAVDRLYDVTQQVAYFNIVIPLLMQAYNGILRSCLKYAGIDLAQVDIMARMEELDQFDPNVHLDELNKQYRSLDSALQERIRQSDYRTFRQLDGIEPFQARVETFIEQFGHLSDSGNDFSAVPWRENLDLILRMIVDDRPSRPGRSGQTRFEDIGVSALRWFILQPLYKRARQFRFHREAISSLYTYGYGLFRPYFLKLGQRLVERQIIDAKEDVFYLEFDEIRSIVDDVDPDADYRERVAQRKDNMQACRDLSPPSIIYGDDPLPLHIHSSDRLKGTPTSRGHYTGPVKVISSMGDFHKLQSGDVLVIPYSDVGWTPLFAKAGAVVAESGGVLSHSSIIAREYGIPAVVSVHSARQLQNNTIVTVDGYRGQVLVRKSPCTNELEREQVG